MLNVNSSFREATEQKHHASGVPKSSLTFRCSPLFQAEGIWSIKRQECMAAICFIKVHYVSVGEGGPIASGSELTSMYHLKQLRSQSLYSVLNGKLVNRQIDHICTLFNSFFLFESDIPLWQDLIPSWFNQAWD